MSELPAEKGDRGSAGIRWRLILILTIFVFFILIIYFGWTPIYYHLKPLPEFIPLDADGRVVYERGAERPATDVAGVLHISIEAVEARQYRKFAGPVLIHVCSSRSSIGSMTGHNVRAVVTYDGLFIAPAEMRSTEEVRQYLTHELSHLHIQQQVGIFAYIANPSWFLEGLATYVSDGGGAQTVSSEQARVSILNGASFKPIQSEGILLKKTATAWNLSYHMFYRQAMMFVSYLKTRDEDAFKRFLLMIQDGTGFESAFKTSYGKEIDFYWRGFIEALKSSRISRDSALHPLSGH